MNDKKSIKDKKKKKKIYTIYDKLNNCQVTPLQNR